MRKRVYLIPEDVERMAVLGRRIRVARLRRNLAQEEVARRAGVTRKTVAALEDGNSGVSVGCLMKTLAILGYPERLETILDSDPIGADLELDSGRKRAGASDAVEDF